MGLMRNPIRSRGLFAAAFLLAWCCQLPAAEFPHRAEVTKIESLSHDVKRFTLRSHGAASFSFKPGQFILLRVPDDYLREWNLRYGTSHRDVSRPYSFASSPSSLPHFDLIIKHYPAPAGKDVPPGLVSTYAHEELKVGDTVQLSEPMGSLYLGNDSKRPILVVAGGVGVSPFVGLLEYWFEKKIDRERPIYLFFGVRGRRDLLLDESFSEWAEQKSNFHYVPALSHPQESDAWMGETGYINVVLERHSASSLDADVYLAGAPIMITETVKVLEAKGLPSDRIHHDPIQVR